MKNKMSEQDKIDAVIIATTNRKGRIDMDEVFETANNSFRDDNEPSNSPDYFVDILYSEELLREENGRYMSKADKEGCINDLIKIKEKVDNIIKDFEQIPTFEGE